MEKHTKSCECLPFYENRVAPWIIKQSNALGKQISDEGIALLKEKIGTNLLLLTQELNKLAVYVTGRPAIEAGDVEELTGELASHTVFELTDAVGFRNKDNAIKLLQELVRDREEGSRIFVMLVRHFRMMWHAKLLQSRGSSIADICGAISLRQSLAEKFFRQVDSIKLEKFPEIFEKLLKADLELKKGADPKLTLEFLVLDLSSSSLSAAA